MEVKNSNMAGTSSIIVSPAEDLDCQDSSHGSQQDDGAVYPTGAKRMVILTSMAIATFLVALDNTIIGTAIPKITNDFKALNDVGWYGSAYLFTLCAFQLLFGKLYSLFPIKRVFIASVVIFEVGSAVCGAAPTSAALIVGRAIAGIGAAGNFSGLLVTVAHTLPLAKRPAYEGVVGAAWGIACATGPLIGGALTDRVSWRWCFYINLPIGALVITALIFAFNVEKQPSEDSKPLTWRRALWRLDPLGTVTLIPCIVCCLLALQWGGSTYPWKDARIIVLFVVAGLLLIAWTGIQLWMGEDASVPLRIVNQRSIMAGVWIEICLGATLYTFVYFLPVWFQAIKGTSAWQSGVRIIPLLVGMILTSIIAGIAVTAFGYYTPAMIASSVVMSIGAGLITTFTKTTGHSKWIGYQVLLGAGLGMGMQQPLIASQAVLKLQDVPVASSVLVLMQNLGGSIFLAIANTVFLNRLISGLGQVEGFDPRTILNTGATDLDFSPATTTAYNHALRGAFYVPLAMASLSIFGSLAMEWRSVKQKEDAPDGHTKVEQMKGVAEKAEGCIKRRTDDTRPSGL